ncbi:MAG: hypothetical protein NTY56_00885 [Patescibacteria group bacterium]|nr:hypothetical protein [Patescibacteria group bacterium]
MEIPQSNEPEPTPNDSKEKFSSAMDKIESAREGFLDRVKKSREMIYEEESELNDLTDSELMEIFSDFETDRIEDFLKKENDTNFINRAEFNRDDLPFEDPDASTLIDSKNKTFLRGEASSYNEEFDQKNSTEAIYSIGPLGMLEIGVISSHQTLPDKATTHPLESPLTLPGNDANGAQDQSPVSYEIMQPEKAKEIANFIASVADFLEELYSNPNLEIILSDNKTRYEIIDTTEEQ